MATDEQLYRKVGRHYRACRPFEGFPARGVWLVTDDREIDGHLVGVSWTRLGDVPPAAALDRAALEPHRAAAQAAVKAAVDRECERLWRQYATTDRPMTVVAIGSVHDLVDAVFDAISGGAIDVDDPVATTDPDRSGAHHRGRSLVGGGGGDPGST